MLAHDTLFDRIFRAKFFHQSSQTVHGGAGELVDAELVHVEKRAVHMLYWQQILCLPRLEHGQREQHCGIKSQLSHRPAHQCSLALGLEEFETTQQCSA